ncbi:hypothetical protein GCM10011515_11070 [Tsuneonella deserti]|uniref:Uncharacterized protein n=1 Tax=Tsuneonella deserti TaxID=2035528 RepID=A0ABQ1S6R3_9SPHN|nr:hypothetical protein GCM10011515_11070 [Tsuneonella deserti]
MAAMYSAWTGSFEFNRLMLYWDWKLSLAWMTLALWLMSDGLMGLDGTLCATEADDKTSAIAAVARTVTVD